MRLRKHGFLRHAFLADRHAVFTSGRKRTVVQRKHQVRRRAAERVKLLLGALGQLGNRTQQRPCIRVRRPVEDIPHGAPLKNLTCIHHLNAVGKIRYQPKIVCYQQHGAARFAS